jgi:hypothetical protein
MCLIRKPNPSRDLGNALAPAQAFASKLQAAVNQVAVRREPIASLESTNQIGRRKLHRSSDIRQRQSIRAMLSDKIRSLGHLVQVIDCVIAGRLQPYHQMQKEIQYLSLDDVGGSAALCHQAV